MERGEGGYQPDIELVDKQPKSAESASKKPDTREYAGGNNVRFEEWLEGQKTGRVLEGVVVGVDTDSLRIMERRLGSQDQGPVTKVAIENVIGKQESNGESGQKAA